MSDSLHDEANSALSALDKATLIASLEAAEKARREYISLTTHQLRVPLTSILGYADLMLNGVAGPLNERQEQFMVTIRRNVERMTILIADLSDLNRIQDGRMPLNRTEIDMKELVDTVIGEMAGAINGRDHDMQLQLPPGLPAAYGDRLAIKRVFEKILANAILYTPEGGQLTAGVIRRDDEIQVTVADNGIGISAEDQAQIFRPFFRSEDEAVRENVGWGLSLALAKALVEVQDGRFWYESELGAGSAFHFALPVVGTQSKRPASN